MCVLIMSYRIKIYDNKMERQNDKHMTAKLYL